MDIRVVLEQFLAELVRGSIKETRSNKNLKAVLNIGRPSGLDL
jgi:hypothetical protein